MAKQRIRKSIVIGLGILSPLLLFGSVGALEMDRIGFTQCGLQCVLAFYLMWRSGR